jgi:hypothetical protein
VLGQLATKPQDHDGTEDRITASTNYKFETGGNLLLNQECWLDAKVGATRNHA